MCHKPQILLFHKLTTHTEPITNRTIALFLLSSSLNTHYSTVHREGGTGNKHKQQSVVQKYNNQIIK